MQRHLADHEEPQQEQGFAHMLRAAAPGRRDPWEILHQRQGDSLGADRSLVEFTRIEKGRMA